MMRPTILICDDEAMIRSLVRACLRVHDVELAEAGDGDEAIELASSRPLDLILLDQMMPRRSGLDTLRALRADPSLAEVPVLMLTGRADEGSRDAALAAGATGFLAKPFSVADLLAAVNGLLPIAKADR